MKKLNIFIVMILAGFMAIPSADALSHRRKHVRAYGITWDEGQTSPAGARVGQGKSRAVSAALPEHLALVQSRMKRCVVEDGGAVAYYLYPTDSTLKADGSTPSVLDGTDGQGMVGVQT